LSNCEDNVNGISRHDLWLNYSPEAGALPI
jgi:hypothetical protein